MLALTAGLEIFGQFFGSLVPQSSQELISAENSPHALHKAIWSPQGRACSHRDAGGGGQAHPCLAQAEHTKTQPRV